MRAGPGWRAGAQARPLHPAAATGAAPAADTHADWITPAEATQFRTTPSYADTLAYLQRLQRAAPVTIHLQTFGTTPQGRPMTVVIASTSGTFNPAAAQAADKRIEQRTTRPYPGTDQEARP